jgi:hypothetical protein
MTLSPTQRRWLPAAGRQSRLRTGVLPRQLQREIAHRTALPAIRTPRVEADAVPVARPTGGGVPRSGIAAPALRTPVRVELGPAIVNGDGRRRTVPRLAARPRQHPRQSRPIATAMLRAAVASRVLVVVAEVPRLIGRDRLPATPTDRPAGPHLERIAAPQLLMKRAVAMLAVTVMLTHRGEGRNPESPRGEMCECGGQGGVSAW